MAETTVENGEVDYVSSIQRHANRRCQNENNQFSQNGWKSSLLINSVIILLLLLFHEGMHFANLLIYRKDSLNFKQLKRIHQYRMNQDFRQIIQIAMATKSRKKQQNMLDFEKIETEREWNQNQLAILIRRETTLEKMSSSIMYSTIFLLPFTIICAVVSCFIANSVKRSTNVPRQIPANDNNNFCKMMHKWNFLRRISFNVQLRLATLVYSSIFLFSIVDSVFTINLILENILCSTTNIDDFSDRKISSSSLYCFTDQTPVLYFLIIYHIQLCILMVLIYLAFSMLKHIQRIQTLSIIFTATVGQQRHQRNCTLSSPSFYEVMSNENGNNLSDERLFRLFYNNERPPPYDLTEFTINNNEVVQNLESVDLERNGDDNERSRNRYLNDNREFFHDGDRSIRRSGLSMVRDIMTSEDERLLGGSTATPESESSIIVNENNHRSESLNIHTQ